MSFLIHVSIHCGQQRLFSFISILRSTMSFLVVVYHTLCKKCFATFFCDAYPDGKSYISSGPEVQCWTTSHWIMVAISVLYILVIIIGIPFWMISRIISHQRRNTLNDWSVLQLWSFLHDRYENDYKVSNLLMFSCAPPSQRLPLTPVLGPPSWLCPALLHPSGGKRCFCCAGSPSPSLVWLSSVLSQAPNSRPLTLLREPSTPRS